MSSVAIYDDGRRGIALIILAFRNMEPPLAAYTSRTDHFARDTSSPSLGLSGCVVKELLIRVLIGSLSFSVNRTVSVF